MARRRRGRWLRWPVRIVVFLVLLAAGAAGVLFLYARASIPDFDGRRVIAGMTEPVTVIRDENAVPHIYAATDLDGYRALGFVHAQDRFFQMEMNRRLGAGRIAEIAGAGALPIDRFMRLLNFPVLVAEIVEQMDPAPRAALEAYSEGVNAWLSSDERRLPPEFLLTLEPEPWRPEDSVIWGKLMALRLSGNFNTELLRARLAKRLSEGQIADLWAQDGNATTTLADAGALLGADRLDSLAAAVPDVFATASASNEWITAGHLTQSGKPLLANDPHLGFSAPGLWYLARIVTPDFEIAGATVPGVPFTLLGHNTHVAWGLTTAEADVQDLFIERLAPDAPGQYLTPGGPAPFVTREERIDVRFRSEPEILTIRETRHGPILSDIDPSVGDTVEGGHVLALAFTGARPDDRTAEGMYFVNRATDWRSFRSALRLFGAPIQNFAYADTAGRIGFLTPGRIPIRRSGNGSRPMPGWTGASDWTGFVPFGALPQLVDPPSGRIVNANNRLVGDGYRYFIAADWPPAFRAERIEKLLRDEPQHSPATFAAIQNDAVSEAAQDIVPRLLELVSDQPLAQRETAAVNMLADWNGLMARERAEPLIFLAWLMRLGDHLWNDELGGLANDYRGLRPQVIRHILDRRPIWCDDVGTPAVETCEGQAAAALQSALDLLASRFGDRPSDWRWEDAHVATFQHQFLGRFPVLRQLTEIAIPTDGGPFTVNRGVARLTEGDSMFNHVHGPGFRAIYDLSDLADTRFMIGTGQSGHPLSRHYDDLIERWRDGLYVRVGGSLDVLTESAIGVMTLAPAP